MVNMDPSGRHLILQAWPEPNVQRTQEYLQLERRVCEHKITIDIRSNAAPTAPQQRNKYMIDVKVRASILQPVPGCHETKCLVFPKPHTLFSSFPTPTPLVSIYSTVSFLSSLPTPPIFTSFFLGSQISASMKSSLKD